jgi:PhnB protein
MAENTGSGVTPYLVVSNGAAAIAFYQAAFGAVELNRSYAPHSEKLMHASLSVNGGTLMLSDDFPELAGGVSRTPQAFGGTPVTLHIDVEDADAAWARALAAGATVVFPLKDQFWGARYGKLADPFGHEWSMSQEIRAVPEEEVQQAAEEYFKKEQVAS